MGTSTHYSVTTIPLRRVKTKNLERTDGNAPPSIGWKPIVILLYYIRNIGPTLFSNVAQATTDNRSLKVVFHTSAWGSRQPLTVSYLVNITLVASKGKR